MHAPKSFYYLYLAQTTFSVGLKLVACFVLLVGILAQSGGFFLHMLMGKPGRFSAGNMVTILGAVLLVSAELDEVRSLSDRIAVMYEGRIVSIEPPDAPQNHSPPSFVHWHLLASSHQ